MRSFTTRVNWHYEVVWHYELVWHYVTKNLCERAIGWERIQEKRKKIKMAGLEDITAELSKLTDDISSAELSYGEVDFYIYRLELLWKSIFQIHYDSNVDSNNFNGTLSNAPAKSDSTQRQRNARNFLFNHS